MITVCDIQNTKNTVELDELVEKAAFERHCKLDNGVTYFEMAEYFKEKAHKTGNEALLDMVKILIAAENRWFTLEQ
jgi:5-hydroxyisourate hydrolase-like protein (transthyretin family)